MVNFEIDSLLAVLAVKAITTTDLEKGFGVICVWLATYPLLLSTYITPWIEHGIEVAPVRTSSMGDPQMPLRFELSQDKTDLAMRETRQMLEGSKGRVGSSAIGVHIRSDGQQEESWRALGVAFLPDFFHDGGRHCVHEQLLYLEEGDMRGRVTLR
jgi:hypothetical protein